MASNIRVVLEVDNKKYIADVRAAETATKSFANTAEVANSKTAASFNKLNNSTDFVIKKFGGLRTAIAGLAFGALGQSALAMADGLQDLSNSSGIATARLIEFKKALEVAGGQADQMPSAINQFARSIDEAAQGGLKAQNSFKELGISLVDLRKLSETDLLEQTLKGLAAIEDPSRRAALMMDKFGKSFKTVDPGELLAKLQATRGEGERYAETIKRAAELNDALATAQGNLKLAFLEAFTPVIRQINEFNDKVTQGTANMNSLITAIKIAGAAIVVAFGASVLLPLVSAIGTVGRGLGVVAGAAGAVGLGAKFASWFRALGPLMSGLRVLAILISGGLGVYAATQLFDNLGDVAVNAIARITESVGMLTAEMLNLPTDAIAGLFNLFGAGIKDPVGLGTPFKIAAENAAKARLATEALAKSTRDAAAARKKFAETDPRRADQQPGAADGGREVEDALARRRAEIGRNIDAFKKQNSQIVDNINVENMLIGKSDDYAEVIRAQEEIFKRAADKAEELRTAKLGLSKDEAGLAAAYDQQIAKIQEAAAADSIRITKAVENSQGLRMIERARLADMDNLTKSMEQQQRIQEALAGAQLGVIGQQQDVTFETKTQGMSTFQKQMAQVTEDSRKAALEASRAFAASFEDGGDGLSAGRAQELADGLALISQGYKDIALQQQANLESSRTWTAGWSDAFAQYKDDAQNAALQSKTYFETFTNGMENAFVKFVQTGKLSFKDLANSMIADFARIMAKKAIMGMFGGGDGIMGGIGKIFGFANGGNPPIGQPSIVGERGPELFVPQSAGKIIPNNKLGGMGTEQAISTTTVVTYNINATDAASFKQQLARDPTFLHAVAEKGRRSLPSGVTR